jgi:hypothetical protein
MTLPTTTQFRSTTTQSGKRAFEAWSAISERLGIAICAPTLDKLAERWKEIVGTELVRSGADHVWIVAFEKLDDAPETKNARGATVACHFCGRQASFIINRIATCERKECKGKANA